MEELLLQIEILWPAFLAGLLVLSTHVPLGREVLQRGIIFLDLAIAQIAAFGVVVAHIIWPANHDHHSHTPQTLIAIAAAIAGSMILYRLNKLPVKIQEAIIGILFIAAATGSVLLLSADPNGGERLKEILVGQILWLQTRDLLLLALVYLAIIALWLGLKKRLGNWLFYPLFAVTITLSTQIVGVYLVFASLIIPSLVTLYHRHPVIKALLIGITGYISGLLISAALDLPAGATIVWGLILTSLIYYGLCALIERRHV